ncbi:MAG: peptide chain release factor N(5)-glutamine methyltransferase [Pseudomonadota bacterium]
MSARRLDALLDVLPRELRLDGEILIAREMGWNRARVIAHPEAELEGAACERVEQAISRRAAGEPLAYITGSREFYGLEFAVDDRVLVPRPETELLVELALERLPQSGRLLDLGTGSGAIAVAVKHARPDATVWATDISSGALDVAAANAARHGSDIQFFVGDWWRAVAGDFDLVVSNPPYIAEDDPALADLADPAAALVSGPRGLDDLRAIAAAAKAHLAPGGLIALEHGSDQGTDVRQLLERARLTEVATRCDLAGHERVTLGQRQD